MKSGIEMGAGMEQQEKNEIRLELPEKVRQIIEQIQKHGFEAYAVGGCVRDSLLGRTPDDWDITTSAKPQEVKAIFPRTIDTGIEHGTVCFFFNFKTKLCRKTDCAHHAQCIFAKTLFGIADTTDNFPLHILYAFKYIYQPLLFIICHGINRKIPAL